MAKIGKVIQLQAPMSLRDWAVFIVQTLITSFPMTSAIVKVISSETDWLGLTKQILELSSTFLMS